MKTNIKKVENAVNEASAQNDVSGMLRQGGRRFLCTLKLKSIRANNSWFRVLSLDKRRSIDAVIQTVTRIQSPLLVKVLAPLAGKLLRAIGGVRGLVGDLAFGMQNFGLSFAKRISQYAQDWGYNAAKSWATDPGFIRFLTVTEINNLPMYRSS